MLWNEVRRSGVIPSVENHSAVSEYKGVDIKSDFKRQIEKRGSHFVECDMENQSVAGSGSE